MVANRNDCVAYCTELNPDDMETVVKIMVKPLRLNNLKSTLLTVSQNRLMVCPSPFSSRFVNGISKNDSRLHLGDTEDIMKTLAEQRKVTVLQTGCKVFLLRTKELLALAESKVKRSILSKQVALRRLDSTSALKLLTSNVTDDPARKQSCCSTNKNHFSNGKSSTKCKRTSGVNTVPPKSVSNVLYDSPILVKPFYGEKSDNPAYPDQKDKYPVQATSDLETDCPSSRLAINAPPAFSHSESWSSASYSFSSTPRFTTFRQSADVLRNAASNIPSRPRYTDYMTPAQRLASFQTQRWLVNDKPDINTLVSQGFFFTGRGDLVRCFQCGMGLKDWMKDDDVLKEHVTYSSNCTYLLQTVSRDELERIKSEIAEDSRTGQGASSAQSSSASDSKPSYKIKSPKYQTMGARLESFKSYPNIGIRTQLLAVAGLYYTGKGDLCRCFACDGGLKDWSAGDDPCKEHATYFPQCGYINHLKGSDYVKARQQERRNNRPENGASGFSGQDTFIPALQSMNRLSIVGLETDQSTLTVSEVVQSMGYSEMDVITAKAELQQRGHTNPTADRIVSAINDMKKKATIGFPVAESTPEELQAIAVMQCMLCITEEPDILFLPCAHHRVCHKCAENITVCPKCNERVEEKIRTYMA